MKSKFVFLFKESIKKKICTKWFTIVNIILLILLPCLINIDSIIKFFGGDFQESINVKVIDEVGVYKEFKEELENSYTTLLKSYNINVKEYNEEIEPLKQNIISEKNTDIIINITPSDNLFDADIVSYDYIDTILYQEIINNLNKVKEIKALELSDIDIDTLNNVKSDVVITRTLLNEDLKEDADMMEAISGIIVIVFILPLFFLIIIIVQMIGAEINEEKTSKGMEIIISSVSPKVHFLSKLASSNVFAITQGLLLIVYLLIGIIIRAFMTSSTSIAISNMDMSGLGDIGNYFTAFIESGALSKIVNALPLFTIIIILTFLAYSLLTGVLASMTTSMEDYQQLQSPVMIFLMIGYYLAIIATVYDGSTFIKVLSFVPFISGILAPVLYALGQVTIIELCVSIVLLLIVNYLLYKYGMRVYKVGILNYSSNKLWKKVFKSLKN